MKHLLIIFTLTLSLALFADNVKDLQKQQQRIQEQMQQTQKLLDETQRSEKATVNKLNLLNNNIKERKKLIGSINKEISALDNNINSLQKRQQTLQQDLVRLKEEYARMVQATHYADIHQTPLLFLLSAKDFQQMARRLRYMQTFMLYRREQAKQITQTQDEIAIQHNLLGEQRQEKSSALKKQQREQDNLKRDERKQKNMLNELKKKEKKLANDQKKQQQKIDELNRKIEDLVRQQAASTTTLTKEQQLLSGGFEANKGRLPWPVEKGFISGFFGKHQHPVYEQVTINNKGIYIQTSSGSAARAVFEGEVTSCIVLGQTYAVIVQHGNYRTVYSNLKSLNVKQGDKVKAKQTLGKILTQADEDNKTELYFQIYKDRTLLNPTPWLAQ
ncbi:MAG: peptidoglycan DD-metalloendopeptidase family protein [Paludibacteraceae bacterium]|nr:peptidoglycan DD-metalloendopeptidase family protein [Paludibacteraceae bacterium]